MLIAVGNQGRGCPVMPPYDVIGDPDPIGRSYACEIDRVVNPVFTPATVGGP
jgi:hypothetical protein